MADNKSCEGKKTISVGTVTVDIDVSGALKGLKAVQREARKAVAELKKLETLLELKGKLPGQIKTYGKSVSMAAYDEFHCPKCEGYNVEETTLRNIEGEELEHRINCLECGWFE